MDRAPRNGDEVWIFGYGSLVWRPDFPSSENHWGYVTGWKRRFWQGSPDHRGVEENPGRVVSLYRDQDVGKYEKQEGEGEVVTWGRIWKIKESEVECTMAMLDIREIAGYEKAAIGVSCVDGAVRNATVFVATPDNSHFIGPTTMPAMAEHIVTSVGPSGPNIEYLMKLFEALKEFKETLLNSGALETNKLLHGVIDYVVDSHLDTLVSNCNQILLSRG